eukprot:gene10631-biopygen7591
MASRHLCYFLVATALVNVGDGGNRCLDIDPIANQAKRKGFKASTQYDVGETIAAYEKNLDFLAPNTRGQLKLLPRPPSNPRDHNAAWYVQGPSLDGLPPRLETHTFRIGAIYSGNSFAQHSSGLTSGTSGHYTLTRDPGKACIGVYLPAHMTTYPEGVSTPRQRRNAIGIDKAPDTPRAIRRAPRQQKASDREVDETDLIQVLSDPVPAGLNAVGLRPEGGTTSPSAWYVHQEKPYWVQPTAWRAKTIDTKAAYPLAERDQVHASGVPGPRPSQAIMEYMRCIAVKRKWKWSTYAKNLSAVEAALENLPLYTNQKQGIRLKDCPEWRENLSGRS